MITAIGPFVLAFGGVVSLMLVWQLPILREELGAGFRRIRSALVFSGACMVLTLAFAVPLAVVVEQRAETVPFARLCAEVAAIGESPNLAPLRDSFQMAQIRGECHAPHPPGTEVLGSPFGLALGFTFVMAFACLLVSALARELGTIWFIPALLIYAGLSGFFVGLMLTSKEGWGPLDYACENVKTIARSSEWASVQDRPEMAEMRAACGLQARPS